MAKVKKYRPSSILLVVATGSSVANCLFICAVIYAHTSQTRKIQKLFSELPARQIPPASIVSNTPVATVPRGTNTFSAFPTLERLRGYAPPPSPYAIVRPPQPGKDIAQAITHEGEIVYVRYSKLPSSWRNNN